MPQAPARDVTPEEFARQLGGSVASAPNANPQTPSSGPDPATFATSLGGTVETPRLGPDDVSLDASKPAGMVSDRPWDHFWRDMYAAIPDVTGQVGAAAGATLGAGAGAALGTVELPVVGTVAGGAAGAVMGAEAGAGAGGALGRGIQGGIDTLFGRPEGLQNPRGVGEEANRQMMFETVGRAFGGLLDRFRGRLAPTTPDVADRLHTNREYGLRLSPGEITDSPGIRRTEYLAQRGIGGYARQKAAQRRTDAAAQKAVGSILDNIGPVGTSTGAGAAVQETVQGAAGREAAGVEGSIASNLAPKTGMGATGELAEKGVKAGRTAFARQQDAYSKFIADAPPVDVGPLHAEAWRIFNDEIMPKLIENPALGPKTAEWQKVVRMYQQASKSGSRLALSPATTKALSDAALEKAPYGPLRVVNQVLATPAQMSFSGALALRGTLRDAGKGQELLAGDLAEGLATYFETGSLTSEFKGIRGLLVEAHPLYEQAAEAYRTNRALFQSTLVEKVAASNPESVLATLTNAEGRFNASRIKGLARVLGELPQTYGTDEEVQAGKQAWDTLRAEWFRREVVQDNVFGLSDRMRKVDPDVLTAWFPDMAGQNVVQRATVAGKAFESSLLGQLAEADPSKIVDMIGASPKRVEEFVTRIHALPGPVRDAALVDRVRRAWTESILTTGDPGQLSQRIANVDPELLKVWFTSPDQQLALTNLRRLGNALATRRNVSGMGAYESVGAVTMIGSLMRGNVGQALTTAIGFEGIPAFLSWAMYNPKVQTYLFDAAAPTATVTSRTSALLRAIGAYRDVQQQEAQAAAPPTVPR